MQWCSSVLILFTFLLPTSLPPPPHLTWMQREQHEGKRKRGSSVLLLGQLSCFAVPSFFYLFYTPRLLSPVILYFIIFLNLNLKKHEEENNMFFSSSCFFKFLSRSLAKNSYTFGFVRAYECTCKPELPFISKINCFST